jgi:hypothetical protein
VYIDAMDHRVWVAKARPKGFASGDAPDFVLIDRVVHHHAVGIDRTASCALPDAQRVERSERVRPELDARADLADLGRLLQHLDGVAATHQRQRGGQAADAATGHEYGQSLGSGWHRCHLAGSDKSFVY